MRNLRLDICYDGSRYRGWQRLPGVDNTIQGKLETVLSRILEEPVEISGSGRTDAGVHARHQIASFHCTSELPAGEILTQLRRYLPEDIGIESCEDAPERFHARLNARSKHYRYTVWNSQRPCVFGRRYAAVIPETLDERSMRAAAQYFLGEHDFKAFCTNAGKKKSTVRRIDSLTVTREGEYLYLDFVGNGFLYNMVRILSGTLLEVGMGKRAADSIPELFAGKRSEAGALAPAQGLCLMEVGY